MAFRYLRTAAMVAALTIAPSAKAAPVLINFGVDYGTATSSGDYGSGGPFGVPSASTDPVYNGIFEYDDALLTTGVQVFTFYEFATSLSFLTGSKTWTAADLVDAASQNSIRFLNGVLTQFAFTTSDGTNTLKLASSNTMNLYVDTQNGTFCNDCVSFSVPSVPVPATLPLLSGALLALGGMFSLRRRRENSV